MDDSKIFMFPDGGTRQTSNDVNSLLPLLMCNGGFDVYDGIAFNRWYTDMCRKGIQVDWYNCR